MTKILSIHLQKLDQSYISFNFYKKDVFNLFIVNKINYISQEETIHHDKLLSMKQYTIIILNLKKTAKHCTQKMILNKTYLIIIIIDQRLFERLTQMYVCTYYIMHTIMCIYLTAIKKSIE